MFVSMPFIDDDAVTFVTALECLQLKQQSRFITARDFFFGGGGGGEINKHGKHGC